MMSAQASSSETCPLCEREGVKLTRHHVKLKRRDRKAVLKICNECQQLIHGLYTGTALARRKDLHTIDGLKADPAIRNGLIFIRKLKPGDTMRMRQRRRDGVVLTMHLIDAPTFGGEGK